MSVLILKKINIYGYDYPVNVATIYQLANISSENILDMIKKILPEVLPGLANWLILTVKMSNI